MTAQPRLLGGRYEIGGVLGYGGMAEVHRGADLRLGRDVAVKMLRTDLARDETFLTRFRREAQNAASLNHPSIVAVYDTGEDTSNGTPVPYIVMEYVEGRTLKEVLTAEGRLTPRRACEVVADVCAALDFSHRHQIIHRDVKPGNVMLSSNGQVKVMDFGIARAMAAGQATMTQTSAVIGTAQYLSPEQARGETVDARSDVYATGCLIYELLCGDPPFTGDSPVSVAYQHVREAPKPPSQVNPDVPPAVDAIVLKALAKNAANRYQSAGEMRDDLERAIAGRPVMATPLMGEDERTQLLGAATADEGTRAAPAAVNDPQQKSHVGRNLAIVALVLVLLGGLGFGAYYFTLGKKAEVPDVEGFKQEKAQTTIMKAQLRPKVKKVTSTLGEKGDVKKQTPKASTSVDRGTTIVIEVGTGPDKIEVPDLSSITGCSQIEKEIKGDELEPDCSTEDSSQPEGKVLKQSPKSGEKVEPGDTVKVTVSKGNLSAAPNVVSMQEEQACDEIKEEDFVCNVNYVEAPDDESPGTVVKQSPDSTEDLEAGAQIDIDVVGIKVPKLEDITVIEAKTKATGVDLNIELDPKEAEDTWKVTGQSIEENKVIGKDETVTLEAEKDGPL